MQITGGYGSVLQFNNGTGKSKANSDSIKGCAPPPVKTLEKMRQVLCVKAGPLVPYPNLRIKRIAQVAAMDYASRFGMFHTILYEIDEGFHCPFQIS